MDYISMEAAMELLGIGRKAIGEAVRRGRIAGRLVRGNGGMKYEIALSSLPDHIQARHYSSLASQVETPKPTVITPDTLSNKERHDCLTKALIVKLYKEAITAQSDESLLVKKDAFVRAFNNRAWETLYADYGEVSRATLDRWVDVLDEAKGDLYALVPSYPTTKGKDAIDRTTLTKDHQEILIRHALGGNNLPLAEVIKQARKEFAARALPDICEKTARRFLNNWRDEKMRVWTLCREGEKALNDKILPYITRNPDAIEVGDVIVIDGWKTDFDILHPATGKKARMTIVTAFDMRSAMPLGWEIMPTENTQALAAAIRRAILRLRFVPRVFYLDNSLAAGGKFFNGVHDWKKDAVMGLFD